MRVIGLTGGIGSGKSTVSQFLRELGAVIIDADEVGHQVLESNTEIRQRVIDAFGRQIVKPNGQIDRKTLGRIVFGNPHLLARLNQIMHPPIYDMVKAQLEEYRRQGVAVVVVEAPLLIEAGWSHLVDEVWVTTASEDTVLRRLEQRMKLSQAEALVRIHCQLPSQERAKHAHVLINTDLSLSELKARVKELWLKTTKNTV